MIYKIFTSKTHRKRALREIGSIQHVATRGMWIDTPITFDNKDHPRSTLRRCPATLVLDPIVIVYWLRKLLMDGGSSLNLIYEDTLEKMQTDKRIEQSQTTFKGIIPGREARCSGKIILHVVLENQELSI